MARLLYKYLFAFLFFSFTTLYSQEPFSLRAQFNGSYDFTVIGNTMNLASNADDPANPCVISTSSNATLNLDNEQEVAVAYLYWSGSGQGEGNYTIQLNGTPVTANEINISPIEENSTFFHFFGCVADVTGIIQNAGNGIYTVSDFDLTNDIPAYCTNGGNYGGWALVIIYEEIGLPAKQVNVYDGFQVVNINYYTSVNIQLNNLNVTSAENARLGFVAWDSHKFFSGDESLEVNGVSLSNPPLNPAGNIFNGTNSYTGSDTLWNMDLDYFDISSAINVGDTSATITLSSYLNDYVALHNIVTAIPTELPDATLEIVSADFNLPCEGDNMDVTVMLSNTNATAPLPAGTPISFFFDDPFGNQVFSASTTTSEILPIGASISISLSVPMPPEVSDSTVLTAIANMDQSGQSPINENNLLNNSDSVPVVLPEPPPPFQPEDLSACGEVGTDSFDLWNALTNVDTTDLDVAFFLTLAEAESDQADPIPTPENFAPTNNEQTIFVRLTNDAGCSTIDSFSIEVLELPTVVQPSPLVKCESGPPVGIEQFPIVDKIDEITGGNSTYETSFFATEILAENGDPNDVLSSPFENTQPYSQTIFARVENVNDCIQIVPLELEVVEHLEAAQESVVFSDCGENGTMLYNLNALTTEILAAIQLPGLELTFYESETDAENGSPEIGDPENYSVTGTATLWVRAENAGGCFALAQLILEVDEKPVIANQPEDMLQCVEGETLVFDLTQQNATVDPQSLFDVNYYASQPDFQNQNPIGDPANFSPENLPKTVFVALTDPETDCVSDLANFELPAVERPEIDLSDFQEQVICVDPETGEALPGETPILLDTGLSASDYEFTWQQNGESLDFHDAAMEIDTVGTYSVVVNPLVGPECPATASVNIGQSSAPLFDFYQPGGFGEDPAVEVVNIQGYGNYEFSIDGVNFVPVSGDKVVFENLSGREITVIGRDRNGCGETIKSLLLLSYPKFFTPNGDGINDQWGVPTLSNNEGLEINIFDRYGKLLATIGNPGSSWEGTYNGKEMPSNEYWFSIKYPTEDGGFKMFVGSFTLKR
ncbi:MAG TPA: T9SS type B sorting domain-containing protein [Flavobacteriaceae bacterium]|nr:T9SS type B sorting domain-containing protein [Flavobacteriaceae bacterium]